MSINNPTLTFKLEDLEAILMRENSIIANVDVPLLLDVLCAEKNKPTPPRITEEVKLILRVANEE